MEGPLGVILLGVSLALAMLLGGYAMVLRTSSLLEYRQQGQELSAQRKLADQAEASRLAALTQQMERRFGAVEQQALARQAELLERLQMVEGNLQQRVEDTGNGVFAQIGELAQEQQMLLARSAAPADGGARHGTAAPAALEAPDLDSEDTEPKVGR